MRKLTYLALLLASVTTAKAQTPQTVASAEPQLVDRVVALVGDTVILASDIEAELQQLRLADQLPQDPVQVNRLTQQILQQQINDLVLVAAAREEGQTATEDEVTRQVDEWFGNLRQQFGSEAELNAALAESGLSRDQYRQTLTGQARDENITQKFVGEKLRNRARPVINERDIQAFFDAQKSTLGERPATVSFRQVVVGPRPSESARAAAIAEAEQVLTELQSGGDFEVLARRFSDDPGTKEVGGDLGWFTTGRMVPEFERVAFALRPNQTSGIVETPYGFHIIRVDRTRGAERQARHILIQPEINEADQQQARTRADSVVSAIRAGASVADLADLYNPTDEQESVSRYPVEQLPPEYATALQNASVGDVVGPIEVPNPQGTRWAVVRVTETAAAGPITIDDVRDQIRDRLQQTQMLDQLLSELKERIYVKILPQPA